MISTPKLAQLAALADRQDWRVVLIGDPHQLAAVGRSGMFAHLVDTGHVIELDRIHRFTQPLGTRREHRAAPRQQRRLRRLRVARPPA